MKLNDLYLEGQAVRLSSDMRAFVKEAMTAFFRGYKSMPKKYVKSTDSDDCVTHGRRVYGGDYGERLVWIVFWPVKSEWRPGASGSHHTAGASLLRRDPKTDGIDELRAELEADPDAIVGVIQYYVDPRLVKPDERDLMAGAVEHELVHIFDPREAIEYGFVPGKSVGKSKNMRDFDSYEEYKEKGGDWSREKYSDWLYDKYVTQGAEIEAYSRQIAIGEFKEILRSAKRLGDGWVAEDEVVRKLIRKNLDINSNRILSIWKRKKPSAWRKYKRTLFELYREWAEKQSPLVKKPKRKPKPVSKPLDLGGFNLY